MGIEFSIAPSSRLQVNHSPTTRLYKDKEPPGLQLLHHLQSSNYEIKLDNLYEHAKPNTSKSKHAFLLQQTLRRPSRRRNRHRRPPRRAQTRLPLQMLRPELLPLDIHPISISSKENGKFISTRTSKL